MGSSDGLEGTFYPGEMERAKVWLDRAEHMDGRLILSVGKPVSLRIAYLDGRLMVNSWGGARRFSLRASNGTS